MENSSDTLQRTIVRSDQVQAAANVSDVEFFLKNKGFGDGKDLAYFAIQHSARRTLPYGRWTCEDGRQVLFNREYQPILQSKDGVFGYCDRNEWVDNFLIVKVEYFYDDLTSPMRYLVKHLGREPLSGSDAKACKKALLICLQKLKEFTPKEHGSVSPRFSMLSAV